MARRDNAPVGHTCPMIDEVISAICSVDWTENNYWDEKRVVEIMESIRSANDALRSWGNELYNEKENLEDQVDDLKSELADKEAECQSLLADINEMEDRLVTTN